MALTDTLTAQAQAILARAQLLRQDLDVTHRLVLLDAARPSAVDGYPAASSGAGDGGAATELTSVESAANRSVFGRPGRDPIHHLALEALGLRRQLLRVLDDLSAIEKRWQRLQTVPTASDLGNDSWCSHARSLGLPYDTAWDTHRRSDLNGLWPEPRPVCRWVYDFARERRELPTKDQMLQYLERGVARVTA